jgi:hypothetical protein
MAKKVFFSFHYKPDNWRVSQVKNMGAVEGQPIVTPNKWEDVKKGGDTAIEKWIEDNLKGKDCLVVLIGEKTAGRKWVKHEIKEAWKKKKGVLGIYVHNLKDAGGNQSSMGADPFASFKVGDEPMTKYAKAYNPPYSTSTYVYDHIKDNIESWIEEAIKLRKKAGE